MTAFPRHLWNCVPHNISLRCFNWFDIIRHMPMFADCPLGSRLVSWQVELPTSDRRCGWLRGIEDSDRLQEICPDVRMSFHGLSRFNFCTRMDFRWYFVFSFQLLLERCLIRKHAFITRFRIQAGARAPKFPGACCDCPQVRVGSWNQCVDGVGRVSGICHEDTDVTWCYFVSSNPWKPFKHIET